MKKLAAVLGLCLALFTHKALAERESFPPSSASTTFIGVLDLEARYGGYDEWVKAAWGSDDPLLEFEVAEGQPFDATAVRLKASQFTMLETGYEYPSILVYQRIEDPRFNNWVRVVIDGDFKWIRLKPMDRYQRYSELFDSGRLAYLTRTTVNIAAAPGGQTKTLALKPADQGLNRDGPWDAHVSVIARAKIVTFNDGSPSSENWLKVQIPAEQACAGDDSSAKPMAEGWINAHHQDDHSVAVWFYSRGC